MSSKHHSFNVILKEPAYATLAALSNLWDTSKGSVLRKTLRAAYAHECENKPTCPNGHSCLVPHLHVREDKPSTPESSTP